MTSSLKSLPSFALTNSTLWNLVPFSPDLTFGSKQKTQEAMSGEYSRWSNTGMLCFAENAIKDKSEFAWASVMDPGTILPQIRSSFFYFFMKGSCYILNVVRLNDSWINWLIFWMCASVFDAHGRPIACIIFGRFSALFELFKSPKILSERWIFIFMYTHFV